MCNCFSCFGERVRTWIFWILILALTVLTLNDIQSLLREYLEFPKIADMGYVYNDSMKLPTFTVCVPTVMVLSVFNSTHFNGVDSMTADEAIKKDLKNMKSSSDFLESDWDWRTVQDAYMTLAHIHSFERERDDSFIGRELHKLQKQNKKSKILDKFQQWREIIEKRNVTFEEFMNKTGNEVLRRMVGRAQRSNFATDDIYNATFKVTWISIHNLCFQPVFLGNGSGMIEVPGRFFFMSVKHDPSKLDGPANIMVDMNGRQANMDYFEDSGGHTRDGLNSGMQTGTISDLLVEVRNVYSLLENSDPGTKCVDLEDDESTDNDGEHTPVFQCRSRCRTDLIREICHCTPISTEYLVEDKSELEIYPVCDYTKCKIANDTEKLHEKNCVQHCRHGCKMTRYTLKQTKNNPYAILTRDTRKTVRMTNTTAFNIEWGAFEYLNMEQKYKYDSFVSFLSELGGSLGIWLGLSVLSLLQGSAYVTEKVTDKVKDRRRKTTAVPGDPKQSNARKFSQNPFDGKVSNNPFADVMSVPKKRSTASGGSAAK